MSFKSFNCHHIHARNGQEVGYEQIAGHARLGLYLNMAHVEVISPSAYTGGDKERKSYTGPYTVVTMAAGDAYVVEGVPADIADHVTGTLPLRHINMEKMQNVGGNVLVFEGGNGSWVQPESVDAVERAGYKDQGYTDGVTRATLLLQSGTILTLFGVTADTIANKPTWFRG